MGDVCDPRQLLDCFSGDGGRESASNETKKHMAGSSSILDYSAFWPVLLSCVRWRAAAHADVDEHKRKSHHSK